MKQSDFEQRAIKLVEDFALVLNAFPWDNREFYNAWLSQTNEFVGHTSHFLALCYRMLPQTHPLKERFSEHIKEESGHEKMSENDLKFMKPASPEIFAITKAFWQTQYYWIQNVSPTSHLGYALLLEGLAAKSGPVILEKIKKAGFKGYTFLKVHVEEDQDHFAEGLHSLREISDEERDQVFQNMTESRDVYHLLVQNCEKWTRSKKVAA